MSDFWVCVLIIYGVAGSIGLFLSWLCAVWIWWDSDWPLVNVWRTIWVFLLSPIIWVLMVLALLFLPRSLWRQRPDAYLWVQREDWVRVGPNKGTALVMTAQEAREKGLMA